MAKEQTDRTTLDLFANERRPGRPKTNPLSRDEQLRINKRNQLKRDKSRGLKRVELKLNADAVDALNELAEARNMNRSDLIEEMLIIRLAALRGHKFVDDTLRAKREGGKAPEAPRDTSAH